MQKKKYIFPKSFPEGQFPKQIFEEGGCGLFVVFYVGSKKSSNGSLVFDDSKDFDDPQVFHLKELFKIMEVPSLMIHIIYNVMIPKSPMNQKRF